MPYAARLEAQRRHGAAVPAIVVSLVAISILFVRNPFKFAFAVAIALAMVRLYPSDEGRTETVRSFFGVHKIYDTAGRQIPRADARHHRARRAAAQDR